MQEQLRIDPEFQSKIPSLTEEEYQLLEENILRDGEVLSPLIVWNGYIVDGHNRYRIVQEHPEIRYTVYEKEFSDRYEVIAWICCNQLGRRNLTPQQKKYLIGQRYEAEKQMGSFRGNQYALADKSGCSQFGNNQKSERSERTCERIARENNISKNSVIRAEHFAKGVDAADEVKPGIRQEILTGAIKPSEAAVAAIANAEKEQRSVLVERLCQPKALPGDQTEPGSVKEGHSLCEEEITERAEEDTLERNDTEIRPRTQLQKILEISSGMETAEKLADEDTMFYELEDAVATMIRRCIRCFESYPGLLNKKKYRFRVLKIMQKAEKFILKIEEEKTI